MRGKPWILGLIMVLVAVTLAWAAETMSVQVKKGRVYAKPNFLSKLQTTLPYGTKLQVVEDKGPWRQVRAKKIKGWMHISALTENEIDLKAGSRRAASGASSEEMTLAGKGFNKQVEAKYKATNKGLNYRAVNKLEKSYPVSVAQIKKFIKTGGLHAPKVTAQSSRSRASDRGGQDEPEGGGE
jgi:hypothetical protein